MGRLRDWMDRRRCSDCNEWMTKITSGDIDDNESLPEHSLGMWYCAPCDKKREKWERFAPTERHWVVIDEDRKIVPIPRDCRLVCVDGFGLEYLLNASDDASPRIPYDHPYASDDHVLWERSLIDITNEIEVAADDKN